MIKVVVIAVFLALAGCSGCSNTPKTVAQAQVISYAQIASTMQDANRLYRLKIIDDKQHAKVHKHLTKAYQLTVEAEEYRDLPEQYQEAKDKVLEIYQEAKELLE